MGGEEMSGPKFNTRPVRCHWCEYSLFKTDEIGSGGGFLKCTHSKADDLTRAFYRFNDKNRCARFEHQCRAFVRCPGCDDDI